jgi:hypothetical protein
MRFCVLSLFAVLLAGGMLAAQQSYKAPPSDADAALEKKIKELRDQLDELSRKQNALEQAQKILLDKKWEKRYQAQEEARRVEQDRQAKEAARLAREEAERQAKEAAEKKKHVAKVEVRGKLVKTGPGNFQVVINDLTWSLNIPDKALLAVAEKNAGKGVVITGTVVNVNAAVPWRDYPLMIPPPPYIQPYPIPGPVPLPPVQPPQPPPFPPGMTLPPTPQYYQLQMPTPVTLTVQSLVLAKD